MRLKKKQRSNVRAHSLPIVIGTRSVFVPGTGNSYAESSTARLENTKGQTLRV
jgi:hypothetical protein